MGSILAGSYALGRFLAGIVLKKDTVGSMYWSLALLLAAAMVIIALPLAKRHHGQSWCRLV
jgi:hypothetical protein